MCTACLRMTSLAACPLARSPGIGSGQPQTLVCAEVPAAGRLIGYFPDYPGAAYHPMPHLRTAQPITTPHSGECRPCSTQTCSVHAKRPNEAIITWRPRDACKTLTQAGPGCAQDHPAARRPVPPRRQAVRHAGRPRVPHTARQAHRGARSAHRRVLCARRWEQEKSTGMRARLRVYGTARGG